MVFLRQLSETGRNFVSKPHRFDNRVEDSVLGGAVSVQTIAEVLTQHVLAAADKAGHGDVLDSVEPTVPTNNPKFGDYQSNHAFRIGRALKTNPRQVAEQVCSQMSEHPAVKRAEVAGPGFINFHLNDAWMGQHVQTQLQDAQFGVPQSGADKTLVIDFSAPNVAKRMHVGHMRSTIIGDALMRLHRATGWHVISDNHIGDWGTQYGKLVVGWDRWRDEDAFAGDPIGELERLYVRFGVEAESDASLHAAARAETAKLQAGDARVLDLWKQFIAVSLAEFDQVYQRLDVHFDETLGESHYNEQLPGIVEELEAAGIAQQSDGAVIIRFDDEHENKTLRGTVLVIRKQDGAYLYGTTDLATIRHRSRTWSPSRVVYVTDLRQQLHFQQFFDAWRAWDPDGTADDIELIHTWFGIIKDPTGAMSTRAGNVIRLVELMDEAVRRARAIVDEKSPQLSDAERAEVAEVVGVGSVRYADLSQNPQSDVSFDWDRMLAMDGNTAPYLLYSYARCRSIQRKSDDAQSLDPSSLAMEHPRSRELVSSISRFPEAVQQSIANLRPNVLCDYLFELANAFNRFYYDVSVLKTEEDDLRRCRLALVEATALTLERGLGMLGIGVLSRM